MKKVAVFLVPLICSVLLGFLRRGAYFLKAGRPAVQANQRAMIAWNGLQEPACFPLT